MTASRTAPKAAKSTRPKATFSIAQAMKEVSENERPEPFTVELSDGTFVTLKDPARMDWKETASLSLEQPFHFVRTILDEEDHEAFVAEKFDADVLILLLTSWREHYQVPSAGN